VGRRRTVTEDGYNLRTLDATDVSGGGSSDPDPEPDDPCESDNPPDYCDEAGSCYDSNIGDEYDRKIIRGLEKEGVLNSLWKKSNADATDQSQREERGGWIVSTDDGYQLVEFHEVENDIVYSPINISGVSTGNRPSGTVGVLHTQPFSDGETITSPEIIEQYGVQNPEEAAAQGSYSYPSEPSPDDFQSVQDAGLRGYLTDGSDIYSFSQFGDGQRNMSTYERCGY